tara:strand:- start:1725 stop:1937 length:213 start_codon:yes stop_codon:yes gene_type:complete
MQASKKWTMPIRNWKPVLNPVVEFKAIMPGINVNHAARALKAKGNITHGIVYRALVENYAIQSTRKTCLI